MKKLRLFLIFHFCGISLAFSQAVQENNQFTPQSPTISELGKYGVIPISHYTGIPDISIPLGTVECRQLKLPLTLRYHSGGIKVEQIASWVGLGWSLDAGGIISANIMGMSDFLNNGWYYRTNIKDFEDIEANNFPSAGEMAAIGSGQADSQSDIYSYNFNGNTGQFVLDNSFSPHEIKNNKRIKISANKQNQEFIIIDENGIIYEFKDQELTEINHYRCSYNAGTGVQTGFVRDHKIDNNRTAWFLTHVISPDRTDTLRFIYENETQTYKTKVEGKLHNFLIYNLWQISDQLNYLHVTNNTKRLTRIEGNNGIKIMFSAMNTREDLSGSKRLDQIKMLFNDKLIKQWDLDYTYFQSYITNSTDSLNKRLKLSGIKEDQLKKWNFRYYGDDPGEPQMPYRTAFCGSDYWGYCNGIITGNEAKSAEKLFSYIADTFIDKYAHYEYNTNTSECKDPDPIQREIPVYFKFLNGSNKNPNFDYMKAYTLKSISYPTGGYSEFVYEPHDYSMIGDSVIGSDKICGGLRIKEIKNYLSTGQLATKSAYQYKWLSDDMNTAQNKSSGSVINEFKSISEMCYRQTKISSQGKCGMQTTVTERTMLELNSSSYSSLYSYGGDFIGYSYVTETNENGSTRYNFSSINDFPNEYLAYYVSLWFQDLPPSMTKTLSFKPNESFLTGYWGKSYGRGLLKNKYVFNSNNQKVYAEKNIYQIDSIMRVYGWDVQEEQKGRSYFANCYFHQTGQALLTEKTVLTYDPTDQNSIETKTDYTYNSYNQPLQTTTTNSDKKVSKTVYNYAWETYPDMHNKYIIAPIALQTEYVDNTSVNVLKNEYRVENNYPVLSRVYSGRNTSTLEARVNYEKYDIYKNPSYILKDNAEKTVYLWGYSGQYPIAEIKNATYAEITSKITTSTLDNIAAKIEPSGTDFMNIDYLRTQLPNAQVTTYTYKPLVGILIATDPRGIQTTYEYDSFGRLQAIKNGQGKTIENYEYHYKN